MQKFKKIIKRTALLLLAIFVLVLFFPESPVLPVVAASNKDWNHNSFWYEPWGSSGVHKGIDIFGRKGQGIIAAESGIVLFSGSIKKGGQVVAVLGPKWRIQYYAHLDSRSVGSASWVSKGRALGTLGDSGNAQGKQAHLHFTVLSLAPLPWRFDASTQGWKKMFYLNPQQWLGED